MGKQFIPEEYHQGGAVGKVSMRYLPRVVEFDGYHAEGKLDRHSRGAWQHL